MGKSQRYQAAVDGHDTPPGSLEGRTFEKTLAFWRPEPEYGLHPQTLGDGLGVVVLSLSPQKGAFLCPFFRKDRGYDV